MRSRLVEVDLDVCCRSGMCAAVAPALVRQESDGRPVVLPPQEHGLPDDEVAGLAAEVIALCPVGAFSVAGAEVHPTR